MRKPVLRNLQFYTNQIKDPAYMHYIDQYHSEFKGVYEFLEKSHAYIQWLFPNQHKSAFNSNSDPISKEEVMEFRQNKEIGKRIFKSYDLFTDFMGLKINNVMTGSLTIVDQKRLHNCLLVNTHNHLRIVRILACLNLIGFRHYALQLNSFLDKHSQTNERLARINKVKWQPYKDDKFTVDTIKLITMEQLNEQHPIFQEQKIIA